MSWFVESHGHRERLHQVAPRWKHCVLEAERGFNSVFGNILSEKFHKVHREVRRSRALRESRRSITSLIHVKSIEALFTVSRSRRSFRTFFPPSSLNCTNSSGQTQNPFSLS